MTFEHYMKNKSYIFDCIRQALLAGKIYDKIHNVVELESIISSRIVREVNGNKTKYYHVDKEFRLIDGKQRLIEKGRKLLMQVEENFGQWEDKYKESFSK